MYSTGMMTWIALRNVSTLTRVNEAATFSICVDHILNGRTVSTRLYGQDGQDGLKGW